MSLIKNGNDNSQRLRRVFGGLNASKFDASFVDEMKSRRPWVNQQHHHFTWMIDILLCVAHEFHKVAKLIIFLYIVVEQKL